MSTKPDDVISYVIAQENDYEGILCFLNAHFLFTESTNEALKMTKEDVQCLFHEMLDDCLKHPISFLARNERGEIVGVRLSQVKEIHKEGDSHPVHGDDHPLSTKVQILHRYHEELESVLSQKLPDVTEKLVKFEILAVDLDRYSRRGIATEMIRLSEEAALTIGCQGAMLTATALSSQKLFTKLGYETWNVVKHETFLDEAGNRLLTCADGTEEGWMMGKMFKS